MVGCVRIIVVGIGRGGVVYNAQLPEDEAHLQQRLHAITPVPHVRFKTLTLPDGRAVSIIEVHEPFDKPYVARVQSRNLIFVRQGSSTNTATRSMLDRWYQWGRGEPDLALVAAGNEVVDDSIIDHPRPRHVAEHEDNFVLGGVGIPFHTDPEREADAANRTLWVRLSLSNRGDSPALHVVVDFNIEPVDRVWPPSGGWATDPNANCYVDGCGATDGRGHVRQRIRRINPHTDDALVPMALLCAKEEGSGISASRISYRITDELGERMSGTFTARVTFEGTKTVKSEFRPR